MIKNQSLSEESKEKIIFKSIKNIGFKNEKILKYQKSTNQLMNFISKKTKNILKKLKKVLIL